MILDALHESIGGLAEAAGSTASGGLAILHNTFEKIMETIGSGLLPVITDLARRVNDWASSPIVQMYIQQFADGIAGLAKTVVDFIPQVITWFQKIGDWLSDNQGVIVGILAALGVAVGAFVDV